MSLRLSAWIAVLLCATMLSACGNDTDPGVAEDSEAGCETGVEQEVTEGLTYVEKTCGEGEPAAEGDAVTVHYTGTLEDGTEFDSSVGGDPFTFTIGTGGVIAGWDQGVPGMKVGGVRELTIAPELGYGEAGFPPVIPPDATLIFEIEMVEIDPAS